MYNQVTHFLGLGRRLLKQSFVTISLSHPDLKTGKVGDTLLVLTGGKKEMIVFG